MGVKTRVISEGRKKQPRCKVWEVRGVLQVGCWVPKVGRAVSSPASRSPCCLFPFSVFKGHSVFLTRKHPVAKVLL